MTCFSPIFYSTGIWLAERDSVRIGLGLLNQAGRMTLRRVEIGVMFLLVMMLSILGRPAMAQNGTESHELSAKPYVMTSSIMCEKVSGGQPVNPAVVFSASGKKVYCLSHFTDVRSKEYIFHNWFRRDVSVAKIKLLLQSPKWSTFSSMPMRETEKGPWRVEVTGENGEILSVLRFSIVD